MSQRYQQYPANQQAVTPFISQYTPQYDPAMQQMMMETLRGRQERYDQGAEMVDQSIAQFGSVSSIYPEVMQQRLGEFRGELDEIASEYGGDYGMAIGSLRRKIAEEASNPLYQRQAQIAEFAKEERAAIQKAGGIQNVFLPQGSVGSRAYDPDAPLSHYQSMVVPQDDFIGIIDDIGKNIKPDLIQLGLSADEAEMALGMIRDNRIRGLSREQLEAVATAAHRSFLAAAPSIQYAPEDHWTRDREQVVETMLSRWAGLHMTGQEHLSDLRNLPAREEGSIDAIYSPSRLDPASEEANRRRVTSKYNTVRNTINTIETTNKALEESPHFLDESAFPQRIGNPKVYLDSLSPEELSATLELIPPTRLTRGRHIIRDSETGLLKLNPNFERDTYDTGTLESMVTNAIVELGRLGYTHRNRLEKAQQDLQEFKDNNPLVASLMDSQELSLSQALDALEKFETTQSMQHFSVTKITSEESKSGILTSVRSSTLPPSTGSVVWRDSRGGQRSDDKGGLQLLQSVERKDIENIEVRVATGELVFTVRDKGTTKFVSIPSQALYSGSEATLSNVGTLLEQARSLNTPIDSFSEPIPIAGLLFREGKVLNQKNEITPVILTYLGEIDDFDTTPSGSGVFIDDDGSVWGIVDSGWVAQHATSAITIGEGYTTQIQRNVINSFRR